MPKPRQHHLRLRNLFVLVAFSIVTNGCSRARPQGESGAQAEALAAKMLSAIGEDAWQQTHAVTFSFRNKHHYIWDRKREFVQVEFGQYRVQLHTPTQKGLAWSLSKNGSVLLDGERKVKAIQKAWAYFCNDSFWLAAPYKVRDPGVTLEVVSSSALKAAGLSVDGAVQGLMASYASGGVTPGDTYLWLLDTDDRPLGYRMWVSIIPIPGIWASWEDWHPTSTGALLSHTHHLGPLSLRLTGIRGKKELLDLGVDQKDIFDSLSRASTDR